MYLMLIFRKNLCALDVTEKIYVIMSLVQFHSVNPSPSY